MVISLIPCVPNCYELVKRRIMNEINNRKKIADEQNKKEKNKREGAPVQQDGNSFHNCLLFIF